MDQEITSYQLAAFRKFLSHLPHGKDHELVLLKGHLLMEEQVRHLIALRVKNPALVKEARLDCYQAICLAQSFFDPEFQPWLWQALKKLNKLRNDVAHNIEPTGVKDRMLHFSTEYPFSFGNAEDSSVSFEISLWGMFTALADIVENTSGVESENSK